MHSNTDLIYIDPVCGQKISYNESFIKHSHKGKIYYLCTQECYEVFKRNPLKYSSRIKDPSLFKKNLTNDLSNFEILSKSYYFKLLENIDDSEFTNIQKKLLAKDGIIEVIQKKEEDKFLIKYNPYIISESDLLNYLKKFGREFEVLDSKKIVLSLTTFPTASCIRAIEKALNKEEGVLSSSVNLITEEIFIKYIPNQINVNTLQDIIKKVGYETIETPLNEDYQNLKKDKDKQINNIKIKTFIALILFTTILAFNSASSFIDKVPAFFQNVYFYLFIGAIIQFLLGSNFYVNAWKSLKSKVIDSNVIISSTGLIYFHYLFSAIANVNNTSIIFYLEALSAITTFSLTAFYFTSLSKQKTNKFVHKLIARQSQKARIIEDEKTFEVSTNDIQIKDIILVEENEIVPVDGVILEGSSYLDEEILNKNKSVYKSKGDSVFAGSINKSKTLKIEVSKLYEDSQLSKLIEIIRESQNKKILIQKFICNNVLTFYSAILIFMSILFFVWLVSNSNINIAFLSSISLISVISPSIFSIVTKFATVNGINQGAEMGIIYIEPQNIKKLSKVNKIIFDKTGILTKGEPIITDIMTFNNYDGNTVLKMAASAENYSEHILGNAIVKEAKKKKFHLSIPSNFNYILGMGVSAVIDASSVFVGNKQLMNLKNIDISFASRMTKNLSNEGKTPIFVAIDGKIAGIIAVSDTLKDYKKAISSLEKLNVEPILITGDNTKTSLFIAEQLGIKNVIAEATLSKKAEIIKDLQKKGKVVAMIADENNEVTSIMKANTIINLGKLDYKLNNHSISILDNNLDMLVTAIKHSREITKKINENLALVFIYVIAGIVYSTGLTAIFFNIIPNPVYISLATFLVYTTVVANSFRLKIF